MSAVCFRQVEPEDAQSLLEYTRIVGSETDNLTFGAEGVPFSLETERAYLQSCRDNPNMLCLVACAGAEIVAMGQIEIERKPRLCHRAALALSVLKAYWNQGLGSKLLESLIGFARQNGVTLVSLEVRADNERAKSLYKKFGFETIGRFPRFMRIQGEYVDADLMHLYLPDAEQ